MEIKASRAGCTVLRLRLKWGRKAAVRQAMFMEKPPDADGYVLVAGDPGVMEYGDQAVITNLSTLYGWIVPVEEDGSFQVRVEAGGGDWLSVQRRAGYDSSPAIEIQVPSP